MTSSSGHVTSGDVISGHDRFRWRHFRSHLLKYDFIVRTDILLMYIFLLYSLTGAQWSKITEMGYRCTTTASFKVTYVV
jgi:hypothetical protein